MSYKNSYSGTPFNIPENTVTTSASGSWAPIGNHLEGKAVRVQGIYWDEVTVDNYLKIRDPSGGVWYYAVCTGGEVCVDLFQSPLTLFTPFQYFDSGGGNKIIIYGEYV